MSILNRGELPKKDTRDIGRSAYMKLNEEQRSTLAFAGHSLLRDIWEVAIEEPRNASMIDVIAAISLQSVMRADLRYLSLADVLAQYQGFARLHEDVIAEGELHSLAA